MGSDHERDEARFALMMAMITIARDWRGLQVGLESSLEAVTHARMVRGSVRADYGAMMDAQEPVKVVYGRKIGRSKRAREAREKHEADALMFLKFQAFFICVDMLETHHDGLVIQMANIKEDMRDMVHVCLGTVPTDFDPDVAAMFEEFSPTALDLCLEGVVEQTALEDGSAMPEIETREVAMQRGGGSSHPNVEKEEEWKIVKRQKKM